MNYFLHIKLEDVITGKAVISENTEKLIDGFEIMITEPFLLDFINADTEEFKNVLKFIEGKKVSVHLPFYDLNFGSTDFRVSRYSFNSIIRGLEFASKIGAKISVSHIGYNMKLSKNSTEKWFVQFISVKEKIEKYAEEKGITVVWENTYEKNFDLFDKMISIHPATSFCLDVGHCNCFADFSIANFFNRYCNNIKHFHLHDNNGMEDQHLSLGDGNIDFKAVATILGKSAAETAVFELEIDRFEKSLYNIRNLFLGD